MKKKRKSRVHVFAFAKVDCELQRDADVILHAPDLAAEGDALLAEAVERCLELKGVDSELFLETAEVGGGVLGHERWCDGDALVAQHVVGEGHHAVLDLLGGEDAVARGLVVYAEADIAKAAERALVVLGLTVGEMSGKK